MTLLILHSMIRSKRTGLGTIGTSEHKRQFNKSFEYDRQLGTIKSDKDKATYSTLLYILGSIQTSSSYHTLS